MSRLDQHDPYPYSSCVPDYDFDQSAPYRDTDASCCTSSTAHSPLHTSSAFRPDSRQTDCIDDRWTGQAVGRAQKIPPSGTPDLHPRPQLATHSIALADIPGVQRASRLEHPAIPTVSSGIAEIDALTGGLPRGALTEICGPASSGRTGIMLSAMAEATARGELCALVDTADSFSPHTAAAAGVDLDRVLWIRCAGALSDGFSRRHLAGTETRKAAATTENTVSQASLSAALRHKQDAGSVMPPAKIWYGRPPARSERNSTKVRYQSPQPVLKSEFKLENTHRSPEKKHLHAGNKRYWASRVDQALKAADLLLQSGGFGLVILDFADVPVEIARRIPLTSWFRFRRVVENTPAVLLTIVNESCARTCSSLVLQTAANSSHAASERARHSRPDPTPSHARLFVGLDVKVEIMRSRTETFAATRKPPRPAHATFQSRTQWAG